MLFPPSPALLPFVLPIILRYTITRETKGEGEKKRSRNTPRPAKFYRLFVLYLFVPTSINKTFSRAPRLSSFVDAREIFTNCPLAANPRERCKNGRKHGVIKMSRSVHRRGGDIGIPSEGFRFLSLPFPCKGRRKARRTRGMKLERSTRVYA